MTLEQFPDFSQYDYVHDGVCVIKNDFTILFWNKAIQELSGVESKHILHQNLIEYFPHFNKNLYLDRFRNLFRGGPPEVFSSQLHKYFIPCKLTEDEYRSQQTTGVAYKVQDKNEYYAIFSIHDLTEEKRQIIKYREMRDKALYEVEERKKAEEKLKELNASKDKFFSILAHDLKNPLGTLIGFSEMLVSDFDDFSHEEVLEYISTIFSVSKNLYSLLENLLQWSRMQIGRMDYNPEKFYLNEVTNTVIDLLKANAEKKQIKLIHDISDAIILNADKNMIYTVLRNLVSNAIKFTPRGGEIFLATNIASNVVCIEVKDSGIGMDSEQVNSLFRIDKSKSTPGTDKEEGTGLGLLLCKDFITMNHGEIGVQSIKGEGSKFWFTLPLIEQ